MEAHPRAHDSLVYEIYMYTDLHQMELLGRSALRFGTVVGCESSVCDLALQNCYSLLRLFQSSYQALLLREWAKSWL